jgi:hypothetical protein
MYRGANVKELLRQAFVLYWLRGRNIQEKLYESCIQNDTKQVNAFLTTA